MNNFNYIYKIFGRTKGRSNKKINYSEYDNLLQKSKTKKLDKKKKYILDIGSGYGETSIFFAQKNKDKLIITCDKYKNGNINLFKKIKDLKINNISVNECNVHEILDNQLEDEYFSIILIFFPDPWPKKKHHKRRLINQKFLEKIYKYLLYNGKVYIATDSNIYKREILRNIYTKRKSFKWINQNQIHLDIKDYFNIESKFYKKAIISGRKPSLFILRKI